MCRMHGGSAPQVKNKAQERLAFLVDPAIGALSSALADKEKRPREALMAAKDVLDRTGLKSVEHLVVEQTNDYTQEDIEAVELLDYEELETFVRLLKKMGRAGDMEAVP